MSIKERMQSIDALRRVVKSYKVRREMRTDASRFIANYAESMSDHACVDYHVLLIVHSLEKGMCSRNLRPFGKAKVKELINYLGTYSESQKTSTAYKMGVSILWAWKELFDEHGWEQDGIYALVDSFLKTASPSFESVLTGAHVYTRQDAAANRIDDYLTAIKDRHSVREFERVPLKHEDVLECVEAARYAPTACNRQMIKILQVSDAAVVTKLKDVIMGLGGFDKDAVTLFVVTFDLNAFTFYGERNQGYLNAGLVAMRFADALHFKGIGSCFLQWGNTGAEELAISKLLNLKSSERIAVVLGAGYYPDSTMVPYSHRKDVDEIFTVI